MGTTEEPEAEAGETGADGGREDGAGGGTTAGRGATGAGEVDWVAEGAVLAAGTTGGGVATGGATAGGLLTAGGATAVFSTTGAAVGGTMLGAGRGGAGADAASFLCVIALRTSPGREMLERSILVLISSSPRLERDALLEAAEDPSPPERM